jgi:hypothetical protein
VKQPVVVIGIGEMGSVFARGLLRIGHPVYPVTRQGAIAEVAEQLPSPELVLVAVAEADLVSVLQQIPACWANRLVLLQNELLPRDWCDFPETTVISVWFEKKKGQDSKVILPSPVYGKFAETLQQALGSIAIPARILDNAEELLFELVVKNLYILTSNIAGLKVGGTVGTLWQEHHDFANAVASDVIMLQQALSSHIFNHQDLINAMLKAFEGDPEHKCMGRSAPARLQRALQQAEHFNLHLDTLKAIAYEQ